MARPPEGLITSAPPAVRAVAVGGFERGTLRRRSGRVLGALAAGGVALEQLLVLVVVFSRSEVGGQLGA